MQIFPNVSVGSTSPGVNQPLGIDCSPGAYTPGPLDGSLYATVSKKSPSGHSPSQPGVHSPHTVSMDSGISSAGNGGQVQATSTATNDHQKMLDQLLSDMLLTVENIPDLPASPKSQTTSVIDGIDDSLRALQVQWHTRARTRILCFGSGAIFAATEAVWPVYVNYSFSAKDPHDFYFDGEIFTHFVHISVKTITNKIKIFGFYTWKLIRIKSRLL